MLEILEVRLTPSITLSTTDWTAIGPQPINTPDGPVTGRVAAAAPDPTDPNIMYIAGDNGGVWKTTNWNTASASGPTWKPLTDHQKSLDFTGYHPLVVHPADHQRILAAVSGTGAGILESIDGGQSWTLLGNGQFEGLSISSIAVHPTDVDTMWVSVWNKGGGIFKTTDGGKTWFNTTAFLHAGGASDVVVDPVLPNVVYAGLVHTKTKNGDFGQVTAGVYRSIAGGASGTWEPMGDLPYGIGVGGAIRLEIAPTAHDTVHATVMFNLQPGIGDDQPLHYVTTNIGTTWTQLQNIPGSNEERSWHVVLAVSPDNPNQIIANSAYKLWGLTNIGWFPLETIGDDWVNVEFDANHRAVLTSDQGIYGINNDGNIVQRMGNLQLTQFYSITLDPNNSDVIYGVAQDHSDAMKADGALPWHYMNGGGHEAGKVLVDPNDSDRIYVYDPLEPDKLIQRSTNGGQSWSAIVSSNMEDEDYDLSYAVQKSFLIDPNQHDRILFATNLVYQVLNADGFPFVVPMSPVLSPSSKDTDQFITALAVAPSDSKTVYAATADGHVWVTHNGLSWSEDDTNLFGTKAGKVVDFSIDPKNPSRVFAVTSANNGNNIFYRNPQTGQWVNIDGDLPAGVSSTDLNLNTASLFVDWSYAVPVLYVGTSRGVYHSLNFGNNWTPFGQMPNTVVTDLEYLPKENILAAGTMGRGAWEMLTKPSTVSGHVYWDHNGNGVDNVGDSGMAGVIVFLDIDNDGALDLSTEYGGITNASGDCVIKNVPPGTYTVREITPAGFIQSTPLLQITINGSNLGVQGIGNFHPIPLPKTGAVDDSNFLHMFDAFDQRFDRLASWWGLRLDSGQPGGRLYSPFSLLDDEMCPDRRHDDDIIHQRLRAEAESYDWIADLNLLAGREPGEPIGAEGETDRDGDRDPRTDIGDTRG